MARYEHLPIYKAALDLAVHFEQVVAGFSRYHKYTLGTELREGSRGVLLQVLKANNVASGPARQAELLALRERIEALTMTLRVAKEVKAFKSFAGYLHAVALRLEGWLGVKRSGRADLRGAHKAAYDLWQAHGAGAPGASCA